MWGHLDHCWACPCPCHGPPRWHWWGPETWVSQFLKLSIAVYTSVLSAWCQGGMGIYILHPSGAGNQLGVQKARSGREICNPGFFMWEEVLLLYLSICDTSVPQKLPKNNRSWEPRVPGEPLIFPKETAAHLWFLVGAWGRRDGSLQLECLPHWRITHSVWVPARSRITGCCLTGIGLLLQAWICGSWQVTLLLWTVISKLGCQTCWRMSTTAPSLQLRPSDTWSGTSSQDVSCGHLLPVTREREKWRKDKNPSFYVFN